MLVEELLVLVRCIEEATLRDVQVAQRTDIARICGRCLDEQVAPVPKQSLDFLLYSLEVVVIGGIFPYLRHRRVDAIPECRQVATLLLDSYLGEPDLRQGLPSCADFRPVLGDLRQVATLLDEEPADSLGNPADFQPLPGACEVLFDLAGLFLDRRQLGGDTFYLGCHRGQLTSQLRVAFRQLPNDGMLVGGGEFGESSFLQRLGGAALALRVHRRLQHFDFASQLDHCARSDVPLRPDEFDSRVVADDFLVETGEFGCPRIELQSRSKPASVGEHDGFAGRWLGLDGCRKLVHAIAQLVDSFARFGWPIGLCRQLRFEVGQFGLGSRNLGELCRQRLFQLRQWRCLIDTQRCCVWRGRRGFIQFSSELCGFGRCGLYRVGERRCRGLGGLRVLQLGLSITQQVEDLRTRFLVQSFPGLDGSDRRFDLLGRDCLVARDRRDRRSAPGAASDK